MKLKKLLLRICIPFDSKLMGDENPNWLDCDVKLYQNVRMNFGFNANMNKNLKNLLNLSIFSPIKSICFNYL